jgi:hypothetical protein
VSAPISRLLTQWYLGIAFAFEVFYERPKTDVEQFNMTPVIFGSRNLCIGRTSCRLELDRQSSRKIANFALLEAEEYSRRHLKNIAEIGIALYACAQSYLILLCP